MKTHLFAAMIALLAPFAFAQEAPAVGPMGGVEAWKQDPTTVFQAQDVDLDEFRWIARPIIVFADTPADPAFARQLELLEADWKELVDRDVVVITDTDPGAMTPLREKLRPRGFMLTLLGKDGGVKLRKPFPWDVREIGRSIDKMPLRRQEVRDRRGVGE